MGRLREPPIETDGIFVDEEVMSRGSRKKRIRNRILVALAIFVRSSALFTATVTLPALDPSHNLDATSDNRVDSTPKSAILVPDTTFGNLTLTEARAVDLT
jgi:hypothetical protein